jgi:hypothetical protein
VMQRQMPKWRHSRPVGSKNYDDYDMM